MTEIKEEKFKLIITANQVISTDESFQMDNLSLGDNYKPLDAYFKKENGDVKFSVNEALEISKFLKTKVEKIFFKEELSDNETKDKAKEISKGSD